MVKPLCGPRDTLQEVQLLKELTWTYVIENPALAAHQRGQRLAIQTLFSAFNGAAIEKQWTLFPAFYREQAISLAGVHKDHVIPVEERVRLVADTIAALTDRQAILLYQQFTGVSQSSMLDPVMSWTPSRRLQHLQAHALRQILHAHAVLGHVRGRRVGL